MQVVKKITVSLKDELIEEMNTALKLVEKNSSISCKLLLLFQVAATERGLVLQLMDKLERVVTFTKKASYPRYNVSHYYSSFEARWSPFPR